MLDCTVKNDTSQAFFRVVCLKDGAIVMTVEYPSGVSADVIRPIALKFFDSARIEDGGTKAAAGVGSPTSSRNPRD